MQNHYNTNYYKTSTTINNVDPIKLHVEKKKTFRAKRGLNSTPPVPKLASCRFVLQNVASGSIHRSTNTTIDFILSPPDRSHDIGFGRKIWTTTLSRIHGVILKIEMESDLVGTFSQARAWCELLPFLVSNLY